MVQANVDRIIAFLKNKNNASVAEISRALSIPKENVQKSLEYLEEDGVLKIDFKFTTPYVTFLKDPTTQGETSSMKLDTPKEPVKITPGPKLEQNFSLNEPSNEQRLTLPGASSQISPSPIVPPSPIIQPPSITETTGSTAATFMQVPIETKVELKDQKLTPDFSPLDASRSFDLSIPTPESTPPEQPKSVLKPVLGYTGEFSERKDINFPEYVSSDLDKLDFMLDDANKKITNYKYKDMNVTYREIYSFFKDAELTPNERYLIGSKLNELFQRIRRVYLLERVV